jgi:LysM repeat protein
MKRMIIAVCIAVAFAAGVVYAEEVMNYTVMEGENVQTIAGKFNVTVEELTVSNGLGEEEFVAGAIIIVPPKHATGFYNPDTHSYTVAKGDDLYAVAKRFGTTVEKIKMDNNLKSNEIEPGETLAIGQ